MNKNNNKKNRRDFLKIAPAGVLLAATACGDNQKNPVSKKIEFKHGVASGDPLQDRVIIWSRVTLTSETEEDNHEENIQVYWQVSNDEQFKEVVKSGSLITGPDQDYTLKYDVSGLEAGNKYFYRFYVDDTYSPVGETHTLLSKSMEKIRFAVVSCSNYPNGYFNAYRAIVDDGPFDAVLHLGDYIYEYGYNGSEKTREMGRIVDPTHEIITLSDYRKRYACYKTDVDLQEIHRKIPFICVWDDHEFANNSYMDGAQNHDETEGPWEDRKMAAIQAYIEWLPIRTHQAQLTYRSFEFGGLATLAMLDTRLIGRERQLTHGQDLKMVEVQGSNGSEMKPDYIGFQKRLIEEERSMLGAPQEEWLERTFEKSKNANVPWQIIGQQILMSYKPEPDLSPVFSSEELENLGKGDKLAQAFAENDVGYFKPDSWDGYQVARKRVLDILENKTNNAVVLAADTHCAWAMALTDKMGGKHYGAEFATHSITSTSRGDRLGRPDEIAQCYLDLNDHMTYSKLVGRGYMTITVTKEDTIASWYYLSTITSRNFDVSLDKSLRFKANNIQNDKIIFEEIT